VGELLRGRPGDEEPVRLLRQALGLNATEEWQPAPLEDEYNFLTPPRGPGEIGWLGVYRVLRFLGGGSNNVVFEAEDTRLRRRVALKTLRPILMRGAAGREEFLREGRAVAAVEHDHVVGVHQVGEIDGVPYLAMQFLEGEPLEGRLRRGPRLPVAEAVRIALEAAEGLAAVHQRGLVHRDVTPANLWLEGTQGRVKLLDFGLALASDKTNPTAPAGTPAYLAPEQASGEPPDPRSDVFSLGCILYRMCTGELPFKGADGMSLLLDIAERTPEPPHRLNPEAPSVLSGLVQRLLAKTPASRPTAAEAAAVLRQIHRRLRQGQAHGRRWWWIALAGVLLLAVVVGAVWWLSSGRRAADERPDSAPEKKPPKIGEIVRVNEVDPRPARAIFVPDGKHILSGGGIIYVPRPGEFPADYFALRLWDRHTGKEVRRFENGHTASVGALAVSSDGKRALSGSVDATVRLWDMATGKCLQVMRGHLGVVSVVLFAADGRLAYSGGGSDGTVRMWDLATGKQVGPKMSHQQMVRGPRGQRQRASADQLALLPGGLLLSAGPDGVLKVWHPAQGAELFKLSADTKPISGISVSEDSTLVLACSTDGTVRQWDLTHRKVVRSFLSVEHSDFLHGSTFSANGRRLLIGANDHSLRLWDAVVGKELRSFTGHTARLRGVELSADGRYALSASEDRTIRLWRLPDPDDPTKAR
jgi:hypothetical protein